MIPPVGPRSGDNGWGRSPVAAVSLAAGAALGGAAVDLATGNGLRGVFAVTFVIGSAVAAHRIRFGRIGVAVVLPPLLYAAAALAAALSQPDTASSTPVVRAGLDLFTNLILGAPVLVVAVATVAVVVVLRRAGATRRRPAPGSGRRCPA